MPEDDKSILDETELWRRIHPDQMTNDDQAPGGRRPSTGNFDEKEMSVVIAGECTGGIDTLLAGLEEFGVVCFRAGDVRRLELGVIRDPVAGLPGHALVTGSKSKPKRKALAKIARLIREPAPIKGKRDDGGTGN